MNRLVLPLSLVLASVCFAQAPLNPREQAFVQAVTQVIGQPLAGYEKDVSPRRTVLTVYFPDGQAVTAAHYKKPWLAHQAAAGSALYSGIADDARLIELRGSYVLGATAPFRQGDLARRLREAAWAAFPHDAPNTTELFMLNLLDDGLVLRVSSTVEAAYLHMQAWLERDMQAAAGHPDGFELISPREFKHRDGDRYRHFKVTDTSAATVRALRRPTPVLRSAAAWVGLPLVQPRIHGLADQVGAQ